MEDGASPNRFSTRAMTLREMIWAFKVQRGDMEALGFLLEARRIDPAFDVLDLSGDDLSRAIQEMGEAAQEGASVDAVIKSLSVS